MKRSIALSIIVLVFMGCKVRPEPIRYGEDACHYCSMTIVDRGHAAEYVTTKGKVYKFDAIECMYRSFKELEETKLAFTLVTDMAVPGTWIPVDSALFLIDPDLPSPMGENLSAFKDVENAERLLGKSELEIYTWGTLPIDK